MITKAYLEEHNIQIKAPAVVTKIDFATGLQAARILAKYGIPVIGIADDPNHFCCKTNSCQRIIKADTTNEELVYALINLSEQLGTKAVLIPCSDESAYTISLNREKLRSSYHFILPEHEILELFMDKSKFYKYCQQIHFPMPTTFFLNDKSDLKEIAENIKFPCIIKPSRSKDRWYDYFQEKVERIYCPEELYHVFEDSLKATESPILQEWIPGNDSNLNSCTFFYDNQHQPVITFTSRKIRQWPPGNGGICLGEEIRNYILVEHTVKLMDRVKFRGVGSLEMKKDDRDGRYYAIEVNVCRLPLRFKIVEAGGVELVYTMYCEALGSTNQTNTHQRYTGAKWIYLHRDILTSCYYHKKGELSLKAWISSLRGVNSFAVLSIRDPLPFILENYPLFLYILKSILRKTGRKLTNVMIKLFTIIRLKIQKH